jgi:hypothetical protein
VHVDDMSRKGFQRTVRGVAVVGQGRPTVRARSLVCGEGYTQRFLRNSTLANDCAGSDRILQPAAVTCYYCAARNGKVFLPGVAVVMFDRVVLVLGSRGYRYACGARAAGLQALAGRSTSRRGVRRALKGIAPAGANLPGWRRVSACRCSVGRRAGQHWLYRNAREVGQWLEDALDTKTADVQAVEPLLLCAQGSRAEIW